jgi:putative permease
MGGSNPLLLSISDWFRRNFSDPGAVGLFFTALFMLLFLEFFGHFFMPVLISIVLAYLLQSVVSTLVR